MVIIVVEHGLCSRLKSIKFPPVSKVQPPAWRTLAVSATESSSNITPEPDPMPPSFVLSTVSINMVGITISFAGIAMI